MLIVISIEPIACNLNFFMLKCNWSIAGIAQLVEQRTENPRVTSSSLVPGIINSECFQGKRILVNVLYLKFYHKKMISRKTYVIRN